MAAPVDIGRSFLEAQNAFDAEAVVALIAPEGVVNDGFGYVNQVEEYPGHLAWKEALDWRLTVEECTASGPPAQVTCTYAYENAWTQALGRPVSLDNYRFVIANGQIQEVSTVFGPSGFVIDAWLEFRQWVQDNHPEDLAAMYDFSNPAEDIPIVTPEALVLWEQHNNESVASATEPGTP